MKIVIKYGGNAMTSQDGAQAALLEDVASLHKAGHNIVLAHGGGPEIAALLKALSIESRFVRGLRYTDERAMEAVLMALCGKVNKTLTARLARLGVPALGLCGLDAGLFRARVFDAELGLVGEISYVNTALLEKLLSQGLLPVVSPVALNEDEAASLPALNVNADTAASALAAALKADTLVLLTDTAGILRDINDPKTLIEKIKLSEIDGLKKDGVITGGMLPKIEGAAEAVRQGVKAVVIADGRSPHTLRGAINNTTASTRIISG